MFNSVTVYGDTDSTFFDHLENSYITMHLTHYASELLKKGFQDELELDNALHKAMAALTRASLPVLRHFREVYVSESGTIKKDWAVSDLGYRLIVFNADISNPVVAKLQVEILENHVV
jgi:hypothetical protein